MFTKRSIFRTLTVLIVVLMMSGMASASPLASGSPGTAFTYQGRLSAGGSPASGTYALRFKLYNDLSAGAQVGSTVDKGGVSVTNGLFTVLLDFGDVFDGTPLYLEVSVGSGYTPLTPRQALTPTPYAIYAEKVPWGGIIGIPAGVGGGYKNVIIVAKSGGDYDSISGALGSLPISGPGTPSADNPYLIYVAPGVYTEVVTMKPYVDIEGSGELTTKITSGVNGGTVVGADNAELRFLTVENTGGNTYSTGIFNSGVSPRLTHVTANASGGTNMSGVYNSAATIMTYVTATATGGVNSYGVYNDVSSSPTMTNVTANGSGGTNNYGVYNSAATTMKDVTAKASGGDYSYGVYNGSGSSTTMTGINASAGGGTQNNVGVYNIQSTSTLTDSVARASGGGVSWGIYNKEGTPAMTNVTATASNSSSVSFGVQNDGSSPTMTNVVARAWGSSSENYGVVNSGGSPVMKDVIASGSGGINSMGVDNSYSSPSMENVSASASGASLKNCGVLNESSSSIMINVTANATGGAFSYGVETGDSTPTMTGVTATASLGTTESIAISNGYASPMMTNVTASASGPADVRGVYNVFSSPTMMGVKASAVGGTLTYGVYNYYSTPAMTNVSASASDGLNSYGVYNDSSSPTISNSVISGSGVSAMIFGIYNIATSGSYTVQVSNSKIIGSTNTIYNNSYFITRVGASQLSGWAVFPGGGTVSCIGVYDENYANLLGYTTCP